MRRALDVLGVYILPLCCFALDYVLQGVWLEAYPLALFTLAATGMIAFARSSRPMRTRAASVAAGALVTSAVGAGLIGIPLLFVGLFGLFAFLTTGYPLFALAVMAFVPWLTAERLLARARILLRGVPWSLASLALGAAAIAMPTGLALLLEIEADERRERDFRSDDRERVLRALSRTAWYSPRDIIGRPALPLETICQRVTTLPLDDSAVESAARHALGAPDAETLRGYCSRFYKPEQ